MTIKVAPLLRDALLLFAGAVLAVAGEEWRDHRTHVQRTVTVRQSLVAEMRRNEQAVERSRRHHLDMIDTLSGYRSRGELVPERIYFNGIFNPALVSQTAWLSARETGALNELPYDQVLAIAGLYEHQDGYRDLADQMRNALMTDLARMGPKAAIGDRALNYISVDTDFANREQDLLRGYREAETLLEGRLPGANPASRR